MPTAPKLVAALLLAALAYAASEMIKPMLPSSTVFGWFSEVDALVGFFLGWRLIGARAGGGTSAAITNGITGTTMMVLSCLFVQSVNTMVEDSLERKFDNIFEAINSTIANFIEYGAYVLTPNVLGLLVLGAIIVGIAVEISSHYWR
ncbi:TrgA family protein [Roseivivax sp. CAU 1753]